MTRPLTIGGEPLRRSQLRAYRKRGRLRPQNPRLDATRKSVQRAAVAQPVRRDPGKGRPADN
jgi:hypothetical protein